MGGESGMDYMIKNVVGMMDIATINVALNGVAESCNGSEGFGAGFGAFFGVLKEAYSNPPTPTPSDKVILKPVKSDRVVRTMQAMGRNAAMMAVVAGVFTAAEMGAESVRGVQDPINTAIAGCVAGSALGIQQKKISHMCAGCLGAAILTSAIELRALQAVKRSEKRQKERMT